MQEVDEIFLQRSCTEATALWNSKCSLCGKTINRANNLEKHLRSCEKAPTYLAKQQLRQTTLDGPTSSEKGPSEIDGGEGVSGWCTCWTCWILEGTRNSIVHLKVHDSHLPEGIQHQQQKRRPVTIERGYP